MPHNLAWQIGIERFAVAALLAGVCTNLRLRGVFLRWRRVRCQCLGFIEQAQLASVTRFALCAEQFATIHTQPLLCQITLGLHQTQRATQLVALR